MNECYAIKTKEDKWLSFDQGPNNEIEVMEEDKITWADLFEDYDTVVQSIDDLTGKGGDQWRFSKRYTVNDLLLAKVNISYEIIY